MLEGAGQATKVKYSPIPAGCAVSVAGVSIFFLQVNESEKNNFETIILRCKNYVVKRALSEVSNNTRLNALWKKYSIPQNRKMILLASQAHNDKMSRAVNFSTFTSL